MKLYQVLVSPLNVEFRLPSIVAASSMLEVVELAEVCAKEWSNRLGLQCWVVDWVCITPKDWVGLDGPTQTTLFEAA